MSEAEANRTRPSPPLPLGSIGKPLQRLRRSSGLHPEWWMLPIAAAAWAHLATPSDAHAGHGGHAAIDLRPLAVMVLAMMLPVAAIHLRRLARAAPDRCGNRAAAAFVAGYLAVWIAAMLAIGIAWKHAAPLAVWMPQATIVVAVVWALVRYWRRRRHDPSPSVAPHPWPTYLGRIRSGGIAGCACVRDCWALMAVCVAFAHLLPVMAVVSLVQWAGAYRQTT